MTDFTLDTSGVVVTDSGKFTWTETSWSDLSPFAQGYVEESAKSWPRIRALRGAHGRQRRGFAAMNALPRRLEREATHPAGFSDLAPETLAEILRDCEARQALNGSVPLAYPADAGRAFWSKRQAGSALPAFPPLTPYLGDDGKVYLREAS